MPESNLTKKALAQTLKDLIHTQSFEKIGVNDICDACQVSRKTFYYHFRDKYALAEWIFDTEIIALLQKCDLEDRWATIQALCRYFYDNRVFYAGLMQFQGQNSFRYHFQDFLFNAVEKFLLPERSEIDAVAGQGGVTPEAVQAFYARFLADAMLFAVYRWLSEGARRPPEEFVALLQSTEELIHVKVHQMEEMKAKETAE